jgi:hypothetical protein
VTFGYHRLLDHRTFANRLPSFSTISTCSTKTNPLPRLILPAILLLLALALIIAILIPTLRRLTPPPLLLQSLLPLLKRLILLVPPALCLHPLRLPNLLQLSRPRDLTLNPALFLRIDDRHNRQHARRVVDKDFALLDALGLGDAGRYYAVEGWKVKFGFFVDALLLAAVGAGFGLLGATGFREGEFLLAVFGDAFGFGGRGFGF